MLFIGAFDHQKQAQHFCHYLVAQDMPSQVRQQDTKYEVWVLDAEHLEKARAAYLQFTAAPDHALFKVAGSVIKQKKSDQTHLFRRANRHYFQRPRGNPITISVVVVCIIVYLLTFTPLRDAVYSSLLISLPGYSASALWMSQPWRLVTPMFLHFSIWHILFNLFWLYDLGSLIEKQDGKIFYVILILLASLGSGLLQWAVVGPAFGGLSGVVYALFAYIWISSKYNLRSGYYMSNQVVILMVTWLVLCFTGMMGPVANFGHLGGLMVGVLVAYGRKFIEDRH